ncbi:MAG: hypothetical protein ACRD6I_10480 [Candidatus Acidiferrales bacterium]
MRVDVVLEADPAEQLELPWQSATGHYLDLRNHVRSIYQVEATRRHPPLGRFLAAVNSEDSVFTTAACSVRCEAAGDHAGKHHFICRIALLFASEDFNFQRSHFEGLIGQLERLLGRDSAADMLTAELRIGPCRFKQLERQGFHLVLRLTAAGDSAEQAELRSGLGVARVQQALLFLSRVVRQHLRETRRG